jgi:hypothetical protein
VVVNLLHSRKDRLDYGVLTSVTQEQLQPRYRRILSFGDVLDESIGLYRRHWVTFALVSSVWLIPPGLVALWFSALGTFNTASIVAASQRGNSAQALASLTPFFAALALLAVVWGLFYLAWSAAIVVTTNAFLHGAEPRLSVIFKGTLRRFGAIFIASSLVPIALGLLTLVSFVTLILSPVGLVGLIVWWLWPGAHRAWLKWLIIITAPFGLPAYFSGAWSLFLAAAVLEIHGPIGSLRRSAELVDGNWFRAVGVLTVGGLIVGALQYAPALLVQLPLSISAAARGQLGTGPTEQAISTAANIVVQVLFASMGSIVYTMLYVDLRNRREGTDIAERLSRLEAVEPSASNA